VGSSKVWVFIVIGVVVMAVLAYWIKTRNGLGGFSATTVGLPTNGSDLSAVAGAATFYGKGRCGICHTIGVARDGKCPNLGNAGDRLTKEFIAESLLHPQAYIRLDFDPPKPKAYPARMPQVNKSPIGLTHAEMEGVIAFVQGQRGDYD
jgi:hypothetical protein